MNDIVAKAAICVGGFLAMFLPLYLFADPGISPFYGGAETRVALVATNTRNDATDFRNDAEEASNSAIEEPADVEEAREDAGLVDAEDVSTAGIADKVDILNLWLDGVGDILQNQWGDNWTLNHRNNMISATMWYDGTLDDAILSAIEQGGVPKEWDEICSSYERSAQAAYKSMVDVGLDDMHLMYGIANDRNPDNALLVTYDGYIVYDVFDELRDSDLSDIQKEKEQEFFNTLTERQRLTLYLATLHTALNENDVDGEYLLDTDNKFVIVNIKDDGIAGSALLTYMQNGNKAPEEWIYTRGEFERACQKMYDAFSDYGLNDWNITLNLLNDANTDKALLIIVNGETTYDCLEE